MNSCASDLGIDRPGSFLRTSAGWIGTCDRSATLRLLEITRQPDLASCCTWSISTAGVPHEPPHHHRFDQPGHQTDHTNQTLEQLHSRVYSHGLDVLMSFGDGQLVHGGGELLQLRHNLVHRGGEGGVHREKDGHERAVDSTVQCDGGVGHYGQWERRRDEEGRREGV